MALSLCLTSKNSFVEFFLKVADALSHEAAIPRRVRHRRHPLSSPGFRRARPPPHILLLCHHRDGMLPQRRAL